VLKLPGVQFMTPPYRPKPVGTFPDKPSLAAEKMRAVFPASSSELVTNTCYYIDCSYLKSQKMFKVIPCACRQASHLVNTLRNTRQISSWEIFEITRRKFS
jgi:hypothetical protein